jgi:hypothetical protein
MAAALLTFVFVLGSLLGYVVREIISQRRQRRALTQLPQYGEHDLQPARRVIEKAGISSSSPGSA